LLHNWFILNKTVSYLKDDLALTQSAPLKIPGILAGGIRAMGSMLYAKEREAAKELRQSGVRIVKEFHDQREYFVIWSHRGQVEMLRLHDNLVLQGVQKKVNEVMKQLTFSVEAMAEVNRTSV
ncbi:hypothetical protein P4V39_19885, partial [Brevibacillus borstelensis]|uniref:hypothetical protein n=1 Tax=Brevibacillus borstelensis TaxID=45462 RepID=UPI002E1BE5D7|nr:hypothetical protein [Brevibacillus borstelensis]